MHLATAGLARRDRNPGWTVATRDQLQIDVLIGNVDVDPKLRSSTFAFNALCLKGRQSEIFSGTSARIRRL